MLEYYSTLTYLSFPNYIIYPLLLLLLTYLPIQLSIYWSTNVTKKYALIYPAIPLFRSITKATFMGGMMIGTVSSGILSDLFGRYSIYIHLFNKQFIIEQKRTATELWFH